MDKKGSQKFPRSHRLVSSKQFRNAYELGTRIFGKYFVLYAVENHQDHPRLGLAVSKKIGNAVVRNRAKRLIREVFRKNRSALSGNYDLVFNAKKSIASATYWDLETNFQHAIAQLDRKGGS